MTSRPSTAAPILALLTIVGTLLGAYVAGYFWLGEKVDFPFYNPANGGFLMARYYRNEWIATVFAPAAKVEGWFIRRDVETKTHISVYDVELPTVDWPEEPLYLRRPSEEEQE